MTTPLSDAQAPIQGTCPPQTARPLRADARRNRDRILQAAGEVFGASGSEAQMDDVARAAGLGIGTLYRHFPTKTALMAALVRRKFERFTATLELALSEHDDGFAALAAAMRANAASLEDDAATRYAMGSGTEVFESVADEQVPLLALTEEAIARGQRAGTLRADLTVADIPMLMCGVSTSIDRGFDWRRHLEIVLDGMRPPHR
ncbi:MAG TPA: TetR/AcrR family transcriptional regulator [Solirubrobacteraceae bacterium]|nr:TetR/AcrR family transcriptional regulator [Solirubrobacteraceae bacterium]